MQSQDRERASYIAALAIFFGYIELFIPKPLPFFRLGIANVPILLSLEMNPTPFLLLLMLKGIGNSYISGNLFSVFALISITQSIGSGMVMWLLRRALKSRIPLYALSMSGSYTSAIIQLALCYLYIGEGVLAFTPLMLISSLLSSLFVAFVASRLRLPEKAPAINYDYSDEGSRNNRLTIATLILSAIAVMLSRNIYISLVMFITALALQKIAKRRIYLVPYFCIAFFLIISSLLIPSGRVLIAIREVKITELALKAGILKALNISSSIALSQAYSALLEPTNSSLGNTLSYFTALSVAFRTTKGERLRDRIVNTLSLEEIRYIKRNKSTIKGYILIIFATIFIALTLLSYVI